jgi:carbon-monoxide dehydrogenase medium subunit
MYLPAFDYVRPTELDEAVGILAEHADADDGATVYMGGTELLLLMKLGLAAPGLLVDCKRIDALAQLDVDADWLRIGAAVTHRRIEHSQLVRDLLPSLCSLVSLIGNVRVRASGTLAGNLCFADPHSDPATLLIALGASVRLVSAGGSREVACADFVTGQYETVLREDELLTTVSVPLPPAGTAIAYERIGFRERPIVNTAIVQTPNEIRVVAGGGGRSALRIPGAESILAELPRTPAAWPESALAAAAAAVAETLDPNEDLDGDSAYKRQLARTVFRRAAGRVRG